MSLGQRKIHSRNRLWLWHIPRLGYDLSSPPEGQFDQQYPLSQADRVHPNPMPLVILSLYIWNLEFGKLSNLNTQ